MSLYRGRDFAIIQIKILEQWQKITMALERRLEAEMNVEN